MNALKLRPRSAILILGIAGTLLSVLYSPTTSVAQDVVPRTYSIVDTGQVRCYDNSVEIEFPAPGAAFAGQDAYYAGNQPKYSDNGDGTVTDLVTGLMWEKDPGEKVTYEGAVADAALCRAGGCDDWRLPSIKELYSLIQFSGKDPDPMAGETDDLQPFIDTDYFDFLYGDSDRGERIIDSQFATSTKYVSTTMNGNETMFGVNFADGRIKGYPIGSNRSGRRGPPQKTYYVLYVRGGEGYGENQFRDNGDSTITDQATGLTWMKQDSGSFEVGENGDGKLNWEQSIRWCEELEFAGHSDWRLPNVKELQSIVDYTRSPDTTQSAAIDPIFQTTPILDPSGETNFGFYWSGTTHARGYGGESASYVAFGRSQGWMSSFTGEYRLLDVHGAGSQRSDPKAGDPSRFPQGRGPQGDVIAIYNLVRPVRDGAAEIQQSGPRLEERPSGRTPGGGRPGRGGFGGFGSEELGLGGAEPGNMRPGPGGMNPGGQLGFVRRLDRDGDGKVSRQEFDGPSNAFDMHDVDSDGFLTDDEAPQGPPMMGGGF